MIEEKLVKEGILGQIHTEGKQLSKFQSGHIGAKIQTRVRVRVSTGGQSISILYAKKEDKNLAEKKSISELSEGVVPSPTGPILERKVPCLASNVSKMQG